MLCDKLVHRYSVSTSTLAKAHHARWCFDYCYSHPLQLVMEYCLGSASDIIEGMAKHNDKLESASVGILAYRAIAGS